MRIPVGEPTFDEAELNNVVEAMKAGLISSKVGRFIAEFEQKFARYCGVKYAGTTANCTVSLHLALAALGITKGDEVIVPTLTFIATANAVTYTGAKPVFVDSHRDYWCIDPDKIEKAITSRTRAIIPVHLFGHPCDMGAIMDIAHRHKLYVVEDVAEAPGAEYKGKKVGSFGDVGCFSFFGNKIISTGEGGMCLTNNANLDKKMTSLKDHAMDPNKHYWHYAIGYNYRMTNLQAAVGTAQVDKLDELIGVRREIAGTYNNLLRDIKGIVLPPEMPWAKNVYWTYPVLVKTSPGLTRDDFIKRMAESGIETRPFFYPIHSLPPYGSKKHLPVAERLGGTGVSLPCYAGLKKRDIKKVADTLIGILKKNL